MSWKVILGTIIGGGVIFGLAYAMGRAAQVSSSSGLGADFSRRLVDANPEPVEYPGSKRQSRYDLEI